MEHLLQPNFSISPFMPSLSFNPYFYGTSTSTFSHWVFGNKLIMFQSLFLWNIYFNCNNRIFWQSKQKVSILIFMEHLLQRFCTEEHKIRFFEFQSLFLWNIYFNNNYLEICILLTDNVSILIFMEHLLQL